MAGADGQLGVQYAVALGLERVAPPRASIRTSCARGAQTRKEVEPPPGSGWAPSGASQG